MNMGAITNSLASFLGWLSNANDVLIGKIASILPFTETQILILAILIDVAVLLIALKFAKPLLKAFFVILCIIFLVLLFI